MVGTQIDDRRWYGRFDKKEILAKTGGICACCGKQLTIDTMTIEHVIPISRGGLDGFSNTIPLCYDCNQLKKNTLYLPAWFYSAITGTPLLNQLNTMFTEWFKTVKDDFDIEMFPLVTPRANLEIAYMPKDMTRFRKKQKSKKGTPQTNILQWHYTGKDYMDEVQTVTGIDLREMRKRVGSIISDNNPPVAIYTCRKLTTNKILCMAAVAMDIQKKSAVISLEWSELPRMWQGSIHFSILELYYDIMRMCEYDIRSLMFAMPETEDNWRCLYMIMNESLPRMGNRIPRHMEAWVTTLRHSYTDAKYIALNMAIHTPEESRHMLEMENAYNMVEEAKKDLSKRIKEQNKQKGDT